MKICDMKSAFQKRLFSLGMLLLLAFPAVAETEKTEEKVPFDLRREVLTARIENVLIANDISSIKRNLIDRRFSPLHAMPAYRELLLWSSKAAEDDPYWKDVTALVREGMVAVIRDSGMGLPLQGWKGEGEPISVIYLNSVPAYKQVPDFSDLSTLKWRDDLFADVVTPGSIGLSLGAKALMIMVDSSPAGRGYAPMMLASALQELSILTRHLFLKKRLVSESQSLQVTAGEKKIQGRESERGVKMLLAPIPKELGASTGKKVWKDSLGPVGKGTYVPDQLKLPTEQKGWEVKDDTSRLFSQASLLEGLLYLHELLADDALIASLAPDGVLEGRRLGDWRKLTRRAIDAVFETIETKHFDPATGSFAGSYQPDKGIGNRIRIDDASRMIGVLEKFSSTFPQEADLQKRVRDYILSQAAFIVKSQGEKKDIPRGYMLKNGAHIRGLMRELTNAISYMSLMLAAEKVAQDGRYRDLAMQQFETLDKLFWSEAAGVYRLSAGLKVSTYTGASFAMVMEWLRRMDAMLPAVVDADEYARNHIEVVLKTSGLLQGEGPATGEVNPPEYYLENEMEALYLRLKEGGVEKLAGSIEEFVEQVSDQDGDGILGVRFSGYKAGGAPVITMQVGVTTPIYSSLGIGREGELQRNYGF